MTYRVIISPVALKMLKGIEDRRIREKIAARIDHLTRDPSKQGKPLMGELSGFRSLRAVGQRYRIIYQVNKKNIMVFVLALGLRKDKDKKDIYSLAKKLFRLRLLDPPKE